MKSLSILFLSWASVSSLISLSTMAIAEDGTAKLHQIAQETTVQINGQGNGSGVIVKRQGNTYWILTAAHVVANSREFNILTFDKNSHRANVTAVQMIPNHDLAILKFNSAQNYRAIELGNSDSMTVGQTIFVSGFPAQVGNLNTTTYKISRGMIIAHANRSLPDGYALAYFNNTFAGMSGGPILNANSQLVGIHGRSMTQFYKNRGINPTFNQKEGLNLGIPINTFVKTLPKLTLNLKFPVIPDRVKSEKLVADDFLIEGFEKRSKFDFKGALAAFNQAISLQPNYALAYYYRMEARIASGDAEGAMIDQKQYILLSNASREPSYASVPALMKFSKSSAHSSGKAPFSLEDLDKLTKENPDNAMIFYLRGTQRFSERDYNGAITDFNRFLQLTTPESGLRILVSEFKSNSMLELKDYQGAKAFLDQILQEQPSLSQYKNKLLCNRAEARYALGDRKGAQADLEAAKMDCNNTISESTDETTYVKFRERGRSKPETYEEKEAKFIEEYRTKVVPLLQKCVNQRKEIICKPKI